MQRVNVVAQLSKENSFCATKFCSLKTTVLEILNACNISTVGISVYINGSLVTETTYSKPLSFFRVGNPAFMTIKRGKILPKPQGIL